MITIIDYKSGNLRSISNGFKKLNCDVEITDDVEKIANSNYIDIVYKLRVNTFNDNKEVFQNYECFEKNPVFLF